MKVWDIVLENTMEFTKIIQANKYGSKSKYGDNETNNIKNNNNFN